MEASEEVTTAIDVDMPNQEVTHQVISFDVGLRHFAYCIIDANVATRTRRIRHLEVIDLGCKKNNPQKVIDCVIDVLDDIAYTKLDQNIKTVVLIESQMTAIMKCVQTVINAYFKIISKYNGMEATSQYMSAKHKLNLMYRYREYPGLRPLPAEPAASLPQQQDATGAKKQRTKYKKNKLDSVDFAKWLLEHKENDIHMLNRVMSFKKKDDLTDAYLMAVYHVETSLWQ